MPEHPTDVRTDAKPHRSLFERLTALISPEPENRAELLEVLHDAQGRNLIDADALSMIEGVLQQIVGDIEDEYDFDEEEDNVLSIKEGQIGPRWRVKALTELEQFNGELDSALIDEDVDTIGGLVANHLGRMPHKGEVFDI